MNRNRGFTLLEVVVAILFASILIGVAVRTMGSVSSRFAARQGPQVFNSILARARAQAIETGQRTFLGVDTPGDSVYIVRDGQLIESVKFDEELNVEITGSPNNYRLCFVSRGYADPDCGTLSSLGLLVFETGNDADSLYIFTTGLTLVP